LIGSKPDDLLGAHATVAGFCTSSTRPLCQFETFIEIAMSINSSAFAAVPSESELLPVSAYYQTFNVGIEGDG
jgi:hypothetical protein